jgi:hypothetical protein
MSASRSTLVVVLLLASCSDRDARSTTSYRGDPFTPHKGGTAKLESLGDQTVTILLADVPSVTVGIVVKDVKGTFVASACSQATLDATKITPIELALQYPH